MISGDGKRGKRSCIHLSFWRFGATDVLLLMFRNDAFVRALRDLRIHVLVVVFSGQSSFL